MDPEVVIRAVGNAFQLLDAERELVFNVVGFLRVKCALAVRDIENVEFLAGNTDFRIESEACFQPFKIFIIGTGSI